MDVRACLAQSAHAQEGQAARTGNGGWPYADSLRQLQAKRRSAVKRFTGMRLIGMDPNIPIPHGYGLPVSRHQQDLTIIPASRNLVLLGTRFAREKGFEKIAFDGFRFALLGKGTWEGPMLVVSALLTALLLLLGIVAFSQAERTVADSV